MVLAGSIVLDKATNFQGFILLGCGILYLLVVYKRVTDGVMIVEKVFFASSFYETVIAWLYICFGANILN